MDSIGMTHPEIVLSVKNDTGSAIARASFIGKLSSPGRSVPWLEEAFNYAIPGGLEPGQSATWNLGPNPFSAWGTVEAPADVVLDVAVVGLEGAGDATLAEIPRDPKSFDPKPLDIDGLGTKKAELEAKASELEASKAAL